MGLSNKLSQYDDVAKVLNAVLESKKDGQLVMDSAAQAIRWRQRAYYFRRLLTDQALNSKTPYDTMLLRVTGNVVAISFSPPPAGQLLIDGQPVDTSEITPPIGLPLDLTQEEIDEAAKRLGLEVEQ